MSDIATSISTQRSNLGSSPVNVADDPRAAHILAASVYKELRSTDLSERDVIAIATSMLGLAVQELRG